MRRRILCDRHQADLLHSLQLLFEDRLGLELYVPVGMEFWEEGFWRFGEVFGDARLADQYLVVDAAYERAGDHFRTFDRHHPERLIRAVTLADVYAAAGEWEFVCATVQENQAGFHRLAGELGATYLLQVGNTGQQIDWSLDPFALVSSEMPILGRGVVYHQEFDSAGMFGFYEPRWWHPHDAERRHLVGSLVNCMPQTACWPTLEAYRAALPEHEFLVHGIGGADGNLSPVSSVAYAMANCGWGWHDKHQGDGFGHVIHGWAAIGRPLIGHASHYAGRLAEPFWDDLVTCVDLDRRSVAENAALIAEISRDEERHRAMCVAIRARFDELVDFDAEETRIRELLGL